MQQDAVVSEFGAGIAIVGMSCILPGGVRSPQALWEFLCEGRDGISEVPADRWNNAAVFDPDPGKPGKTPTKWGGFVKDIAEFDAAFFGISPREAAVMDPQQRMLLETAWRALEDAGVQIDKLPGTDTGVFIGISHSDYHGIQKFGRPDIDVHTSTGGALSIAANRLSHRFDLRGPSLSVDTACSSSLVALDLACQAIRNGACEMALCGGVNAILTPDVTVTFSRASMLSPDGRCKAFDSRANGYVRGEGAGMVVLKPVTRAIADGDRIHAIIRATAVNQDGRTTTITVPSMDAQMAMLREACRRAAIAPVQVNYVEAHGTGTAVGDPIEAEAIGRVFGKSSGKNKTCVIGSIKSNIGHLEPAAGIVGLIKAALCVEHGQVPSNLHFQKPNPNIRFDELGIRVNNSLAPFPGDGATRLAAVNSFGFGGTNACAILQQPPTRLPVQGTQTIEGDFPLALPLSAPSRASLEALAGDFAATLEGGKAALGRRCRHAGAASLAPRAWRRRAGRQRRAGGGQLPRVRTQGAARRCRQRPPRRAGAHRVRVHRAGRALVGDGTRPAQGRSGVPPQGRGMQRDLPRPVRLVAARTSCWRRRSARASTRPSSRSRRHSRCRSRLPRAGRHGASSPKPPSATASARWRRCMSRARSRSRTASRSSITAAGCRSSRGCSAAWRRSACRRTRRRSCSTRCRSTSRSRPSTDRSWSRSPAGAARPSASSRS